jgi:hypothetical protein
MGCLLFMVCRDGGKGAFRGKLKDCVHIGECRGRRAGALVFGYEESKTSPVFPQWRGANLRQGH